MIPRREEAEELLKEGGRLNPGPWEKHSFVAAYCAEKIASKCSDMDSDKAYVLGLLHDIGRRFGVTYIAHTIDGYDFLMKKGFDEAARVCLTHSFNVKDIDTYIGKKDVTPEILSKIQKLINGFKYDDYDKLIQLCDCIALDYGPVSMEERMEDVKNRYGYYPEEKKNSNYELKEYFENKINTTLKELLNIEK